MKEIRLYSRRRHPGQGEGGRSRRRNQPSWNQGHPPSRIQNAGATGTVRGLRDRTQKDSSHRELSLGGKPGGERGREDLTQA